MPSLRLRQRGAMPAEETGQVLQEALEGDQMTIIVCKCESGNAKEPVITMDPVVIRDRFMKAVQS